MTIEVLRAWVTGQASEWHGMRYGHDAFSTADALLREDGFVPESDVVETSRGYSYSYTPYDTTYWQSFWSEEYGRAGLHWVVKNTPYQPFTTTKT